jgi:hypothetical protein
MAQSARSEQVLMLQRRRWLLRSGLRLVPVLFVSFGLIYLSQEFFITPVTRFLDHSRFILFIGFVLVLLLLGFGVFIVL